MTILQKYQQLLAAQIKPTVIYAWINYYNRNISGKELIKTLFNEIKSEITFNNNLFEMWVDNFLRKMDPDDRDEFDAKSSGSALAAFYDYDFEIDGIPEEENEQMNRVANAAKRKVINSIGAV